MEQLSGKNSMKTIKVKIKNKWLNALEYLLYCELNEEEKAKAIKQSQKLWHVLVRVYDKKNI